MLVLAEFDFNCSEPLQAAAEMWAIYGGLSSCTALVFFSPVVSGSNAALVTGADWAWFPLSNPGIISIPAGFLLGWRGTVTSSEPSSEERFEGSKFRALTGAGSDGAISNWCRAPPASGRPLQGVVGTPHSK